MMLHSMLRPPCLSGDRQNKSQSSQHHPLQSRRTAVRFLGAAVVVLGMAMQLTADESGPTVQSPPGHPVQVEVSVELVEVSQINDRDQRFEVEFYVYYTWHDPRFVFDPQRAGVKRKLINADEIWNPDPELLDDLDIDVRGGRVVHNFPDGKLCFSRYYRGTIGGAFDLHEFPLDKHVLEVDLEESIFESDEVVFVPGEVRALNSERAVPNGWKLTAMSAEAKTSAYSRTGERFSMLRWNLNVERDPHFYFWAIVLPLVPIVAAAWSVFWMNPKEFGSQVTVGITAMLTIVAYRISIDSSLPPLTYMTRMDYFLLACEVFVFASFIVVVAIHILHTSQNPAAVMAVERLTAACRWTPPLLLMAASVLLILLPARLGHWILLASAASTVVSFPRRFADWRILWLMLMCPERLSRPESVAPHDEQATHDTGAPLVEPRVRMRA